MMETAAATQHALDEHGFHLTKYISNVPEFLAALPSNDLLPTKNINHPSALGIRWDVATDRFMLQFDDISTPVTVTCRHMLSVISTIFYPLGIVSPLVIQGRMLLQDTVRLKLQWDVQVPEEIANAWLTWLQSLKTLNEVSVERCMKPWASLECVSELHHFSDASERGFGSCTYLQSISQAGDVYVSLVLSKAKVSPMKKVTIPHLELEAALLSVKADVMLRSQLDLVLLDSVFWVDSQIVLAYINSPSRRFRTFVANRVAAIQTHTEPSQWRYIRSSDNPADLLSRGGTISLP
jgi:hypothetical protein